MSKITVITKKKNFNDKDNEKEENNHKNHTKWSDQIYDLHSYFAELVVGSEENGYKFVFLSVRGTLIKFIQDGEKVLEIISKPKHI